jgi:hypothetical protein
MWQRLPDLFKVRIVGAQETFSAYYFVSRGEVRGPEIPLVRISHDLFFTNTFLKDPLVKTSLYDTCTIRLYTDMSNIEVFFEFKNSLKVILLDDVISDIELVPQKNFFAIDKPSFIGSYNPLVEENGYKKLTSYFLGNALGNSHKTVQEGKFSFKIFPILYSPLDIEKERKVIEQKSIPFLGHQTLDQC